MSVNILIAIIVIKFNGWFDMSGMINTIVSLPKAFDNIYNASLVARSVVTF